MARLLLVPIALMILFAGMVPLGTGAVGLWQGVAAGLADPGLAPVLRRAAVASVIAAALAVPLGLSGALAVASARPRVRGAVYGLAVLLLITPAPGFDGIDLRIAEQPVRLVAFACAVARGTALSLLVLAPFLHAVPRGLVRAAIMAGATPFQAWLHAVLRPLRLPLVGAAIAALAAAMVEGPAAGILAPHLDLARAWVAPASLLLTASAIAALSVLLRRHTA